MVFQSLLENSQNLEGSGDSLWEQCKRELLRANKPITVSVEEVNRLAVLVSKQLQGEFKTTIQEIIEDPINQLKELPF